MITCKFLNKNIREIPSKYLDIYIYSFQVFACSFSQFVLTFHTSGNRKIAVTRRSLCASEKALPLSYKKNKKQHGPR